MPQDEQLVLSSSELTWSADIGSLVGALAKASGEFQEIKKSAENPFYHSSYADLEELIAATRPALAKNGLVLMQFPGTPVELAGNWTVPMKSILAHSSGQWIKFEASMTCAKKDAQGIGAAQTYCRRYNYQAVLSLAAADDDGNTASGKKAEPRPHSEETDQQFDQRTEAQRCILPAQITAIDEACKRTGKTEAEVLAHLGLIGHKRIEHLFRSEFQEFLKWANSTPRAGKAQADIAGLMRQIFAAAGQKRIPEEDVKRYAYETFAVDSMTKLTADQLRKVGEWLIALS